MFPSFEITRRHEPASSPSMKSVLHFEVPGHASEYHRSKTSCGICTRWRMFSALSRRIIRRVSSLSPKIARIHRLINGYIFASLRLASR